MSITRDPRQENCKPANSGRFNVFQAAGHVFNPDGIINQEVTLFQDVIEKYILAESYNGSSEQVGSNNIFRNKRFFHARLHFNQGLTKKELSELCNNFITKENHNPLPVTDDHDDEEINPYYPFATVIIIDDQGKLYNCHNSQSLQYTIQNTLPAELSVVLKEEIAEVNVANNDLSLPTEQAIHDVDSTAIKKIHSKILALSEQHLNRYKNRDINSVSNNKIQVLNASIKVLTDPTTKTKYTALENFIKVLQNNKPILNQHRDSAWMRYTANVLSVFTVLPALFRALSSYINYGTTQFWKPASEKMQEQVVSYLTSLKKVS